jgi:FkbH-like protein
MRTVETVTPVGAPATTAAAGVPESVAALLRALDAAPGHTAVLRTARDLERLAPADGAGQARCRIALVSNYTIKPLDAYLTVACARIGVAPEFYVSEYGQVEPDLLSPGGGLDTFDPDITFVALGLDGLQPRDVADPIGANEEALDRLVHLATGFRARARGPVVVHNFVTPALSASDIASGPRSSARRIRRLNLALAERFDGRPGLHVLDMDALVAEHGRARSRHDQLFYLAAMELSETLLPEVAHRYMAYVKALLGRTRKCLVFDCDDTLWGGIVGEEGVEGVKLGPSGVDRAFRDVQDYALALHRRGVLLALCSKNNPEDVDAMLAGHPHMRIRGEHLAALRVNWGDKVTNLREIAAELNIGLDGLVFVDDNPVERAQVRQALPQVLVPELPGDPALRPRFLERLNDFASLVVTEEDAARGTYYAQERQRRTLQASSQSLEEFLHTLALEVRVTVDETEIVGRLAQLAARTNQFNLTTRRHAEGEIARMMREPSHRVYAVRAADRFGDNGIIALLIIACEEGVWYIDTCLMSCRVIGRGIETALLGRVAADAAAAGVRELRGEYVRSAKNALVADFYPRHGFSLLAEPAEGHTLWRRAIGEGPALAVPAWIRMLAAD